MVITINKIKIKPVVGAFLVSIIDYVSFMLLLILFLINRLFTFGCRAKVIGPVCNKVGLMKLKNKLELIMEKMGGVRMGKVSKLYIMELSLKNMAAKKTRSLVTVGGVALGVGAIVFLVSLGYGLERMVIGRVARLEELKMLDVTASGASNKNKINDDFIEKVKSVSGVNEAIPMVSMVSKIKYNNSISDVMAFGVDERYLEASGVKVLHGNSLKDENINLSFSQLGQVQGLTVEMLPARRGEQIFGGLVDFNVAEGRKILVRQECGDEADVQGLLVRSEGKMIGEMVWGDRYLSQGEEVVGVDETDGQELSAWIRAKVPIWLEDDKGQISPKLDRMGQQVWQTGCLRADEAIDALKLNGDYIDLASYLKADKTNGLVLGITSESTESAQLASLEATNSAEQIYEAVVEKDENGNEWVELKKPGEEVKTEKTISFFGKPVAKAYISRNLSKVFGLTEKEALGKTFQVSFLVNDSLIPGLLAKGQSEEISFVVEGVVDDDQNNYFYFVLSDAKRLGVKNYSQLKVVVGKQELVAGVRQEIETLGMKTSTTLDTVAEIEKLFRNIRFLLGLLGTVALAVASLGMFNTMTVSLLERTREVGVMKAMGMLSSEVKDLFLTESMIMGVGGGALGIIFGFILGKILSLILTSVSVFKGQGLIDVSYVPLFFVIFILVVSILVGVLTGWYPSKRAREISALNALRYE